MARSRSAEGYEKISATLEAPVLDTIRKRTANVSGFLNDAAKQKLYFDHLDSSAADLRRQGVQRDERLYQYLNERIDAWRRRTVNRPARRR